MLPSKKIKAEAYLDAKGKSLFDKWFNDLPAQAAAKITVALERLRMGNTSNVKSLKDGVSEYKIDYGPGYRIYFGWDGETIVILLGGGTKKKQSADIEKAKTRWADYLARKEIDDGAN